jgi:hypothetical protein
VLESSSPGASTAAGGEAVFDATGVALRGIVKARFRFTVFKSEDGVVMARAQERIRSLPVLGPSREALEEEHRHTFRALNASFLPRRRAQESAQGLARSSFPPAPFRPRTRSVAADPSWDGRCT